MLERHTQASHLVSQVGADLLAHSLSNTHGCHTSRLRAAHHAVAGVAVLMQVLCQLGCLATSRLPNNNNYAVVAADARKVSFVNQQGTYVYCLILLKWKFGNPLPYDVKKLLSDCKYRQILSLFQQSLLLCKLTVGFTFFFHVVGKLLLSSVQRKGKEKISSMNGAWTCSYEKKAADEEKAIYLALCLA